VQEIRAMPHYHFSFTKLGWGDRGGHWGRGLCPFTRRGFCLGVLERASLCLHRERRVGLSAFRPRWVSEVRGWSLGGLRGNTAGDATPNPGVRVTAETKSVGAPTVMAERRRRPARRAFGSELAARPAIRGGGQGHARRALGSELAEADRSR
jgi:hypothetical protein